MSRCDCCGIKGECGCYACDNSMGEEWVSALTKAERERDEALLSRDGWRQDCEREMRNALYHQSEREKAEAALIQHRAWHSENMADRIRMDGVVKALEVRLAEQTPVVEAAEKSLNAGRGDVAAWLDLGTAMASMRAARSLRGAPVPDVHVAVSPEAVDAQLGRGSDGWKAAVSKALRMGKTMAEAWEIADLDAFNRGLDSSARSLRGAGEGGGA